MSNTEAFIYSIQHYCIHDGPGIRTTVFFKGCPLGCGWCANPESQRAAKEIGFFRSKCRMCGACLKACGDKAINLNAANRIDLSVCTLCGDCAEACQYGAYKTFGETVPLEELIRQVSKDRPFYRKSGGGVTVSGGEPTMQIDFIAAFLKELKQAGIYTAVETCGFFSAKVLERLVVCTDLFLFDIKHMDSAKHKRFTGAPNGQILENIRRLTLEYKSEVIMRIPVIPGFNDDDGSMTAAARFAGELSEKGSLKAVHLLGFHNMAGGKYEALQRKYGYSETKGYTDGELDRFAGFFRNEHVNVQIGG